MADYKLSDLTESTALLTTDILHLRTVGGVDKKITGVNLAGSLFPVGFVAMFDGTGWVDNSTLPGWYACIAANAGVGAPDMVDRFAMGKVVAGSGVSGGNNSHTITSAELPTHIHSINHDHASFSSGGQSANHTHDTVLGSHNHTIPQLNTHAASGTGAVIADPNYTDQYTGDTNLGTKTSGNNSVGHTHAVDVPAYTGSSGNGGFANTAIDMKPSYYSMLYIRKCS